MSHVDIEQIILTAAVKTFIDDTIVRALAHIYVEDVIIREALKRMVINSQECEQNTDTFFEDGTFNNEETARGVTEATDKRRGCEDITECLETTKKARVTFSEKVESAAAVLPHEEIPWSGTKGASEQTGIPDLPDDADINEEIAKDTSIVEFQLSEESSNNARNRLGLRQTFSTGLQFLTSIFSRCKRNVHRNGNHTNVHTSAS